MLVMTANGTHMPLAGVGSICTPHLSLSDGYCFLELTMNLIYVSQLCDSGYSIHFLLLLVMSKILNPKG